MNNADNSRRSFVKSCMTVAGIAVVAPKALAEQKRGGAAPAAGGGDMPLVEPGKDMAASMNYVHSKADIKKADLKGDRQGVKFDDQFCNNCMLNSKPAKKNGEDVVECSVFPKKYVKAKGWCASWTKKA